MTVQKLILNPFNARSRPGNKDKNSILAYNGSKQYSMSIVKKVDQKNVPNLS